MRRALILLGVLLALATPSLAQIGKHVPIRAGTSEDKALAEIYATTDPAKQLALIDKFMSEFGQGDMALIGYELYITYYVAGKNYDKAFEYGEKALAADPDNFNAGVNLVRAAHEKGDTAKLFDYGERIGGMLQRFKAQPPPEGTSPGDWEQRKVTTLADLKDNINYVEYTLFTVGLQAQTPASKAALLERFVDAFPDSPYTFTAQPLVADAYKQAQDFPKMLAFAQKIVARDPNNFWMLVELSEYWSERREQLDKAEEYAKKALDVYAQAQRPEQIPDEQWQQQKSLQQGRAYSALGLVHLQNSRDAEAVEALKTASPLLKAYAYYYGRNLYFLGFALAKMKQTAEARTVLSEAAGVNSPYKSLAQETLKKIGGAARPAKRRG